jgi:hypothetical protein
LLLVGGAFGTGDKDELKMFRQKKKLPEGIYPKSHTVLLLLESQSSSPGIQPAQERR